VLKSNCIVACCLLIFASVSFAENEGQNASSGGSGGSVKPKIYKYMDRGVTSFSDIPPLRGAYIVYTPSCYACNLTSSINWKTTRLHLQEFSEVIRAAADRYAVDPALVRAIIHAESNFNTRARSPKGAIGLMQLMPKTAREVGVDATIPDHNIRGGVQYLASLLAQFRGDIALAAAAYNAGPAAVEKYSGVPPFPETQVYVQRVKMLHERYKAESRD
jgi:soluble lytic murein transglycosylase-like protein